MRRGYVDELRVEHATRLHEVPRLDHAPADALRLRPSRTTNAPQSGAPMRSRSQLCARFRSSGVCRGYARCSSAAICSYIGNTCTVSQASIGASVRRLISCPSRVGARRGR
jgi:hypothetical protein